MKHTSKFLAIILTLAMALGLLAAAPIPASAAFCRDCNGTGLNSLGGDCLFCNGTGDDPHTWEPCVGPGNHDHGVFSIGPVPPHHFCDVHVPKSIHYEPCKDRTGDGKCDDCGQVLELKCSGCKGTGWELCFWCAGTGEYLTCPGEHSYMRFSPPATACDQLLISDPNVWCHETLEMRPCNVNGCAYRANAGYYGDTCPRCNGTGEPSFADRLNYAAADMDALLDEWLDNDIDISALMTALIAADQDKALELYMKLYAIEDTFEDAYLAAKAADDVNAALEALKEYYREMVALIEEYFGVTAPAALTEAIKPVAKPKPPKPSSHSHSWSADWKTDAGNHWKSCACGAKSSLAAHTPGEEATCTTAQICTGCSEELAPATGHTTGAEATCTAAQVCTACSEELAPATGHIPGAETICTEAQTCTVCSEELAPATGHPPGAEATYKGPQVCTVCSAVLVPATGLTDPDKIFDFFDGRAPTWLTNAFTWLTRYILFGWVWGRWL